MKKLFALSKHKKKYIGALRPPAFRTIDHLKQKLKRYQFHKSASVLLAEPCQAKLSFGLNRLLWPLKLNCPHCSVGMKVSQAEQANMCNLNTIFNARQ